MLLVDEEKVVSCHDYRVGGAGTGGDRYVACAVGKGYCGLA